MFLSDLNRRQFPWNIILLVLFVSIPQHENKMPFTYTLNIYPNSDAIFLFLPSDFEHGLHDGICVKVNTYCDVVVCLCGCLISTHPNISGVKYSFSSSSFYNTKSVVLCLGITSLVCLSVTIFSFQSKVRRNGLN